MVPIYLSNNEFDLITQNQELIKTFLLKINKTLIKDKLEASLLLNDLLINFPTEKIVQILKPISESLIELEMFLNDSLQIETKTFDLYKNFVNIKLEKSIKETHVLNKNINYLLKVLNNGAEVANIDIVDYKIEDDNFTSNVLLFNNLNLLLIRTEEGDKIRKLNLNNKESFLLFFRILLETTILYTKHLVINDNNFKNRTLNLFLYSLFKTKTLLK